jgi:hypothetical protein
MFGHLRSIRASLESIAASARGAQDALQRAVSMQAEGGGLEARVADLERRLEIEKAEARAQRIHADATLKTARSAEERARYHAEKNLERGGEESEGLPPEIIEAYARQGVRLIDDEGGEEGGLQPVHESVEAPPGSKAHAKLKKWRRI